MPKDDTKKSGIKITSGQVRILVIIHAITLDGPLCEYEEYIGTPINDLKWTGDTCHPEPREDGEKYAKHYG